MIDALAGKLETAVTLLTAMLVLLTGFLIVMKKRGIRGKRPTEERTGNAGFLEMSQFLPIDDIRDGMVIDEGGKRFTGCIECSGIDFYSMDQGEQILVQNGFISMIRVLREDTCFLQVPENVDLSYKIKQYEEILEGILGELNLVRNERDMLFEKAEEYVRDERKVPEKLSQDLSRLEELMHSLDFRYRHVTEEIELAKLMQSSGGGVEKMRRFILFSWRQEEGLLEEVLFGEELRKKAAEELDKKAAHLIGGLQSARVSARRLSTEELTEQFHRQLCPVTGQIYDLLPQDETDFGDDLVMTDTYGKKMENYIRECAEQSADELFL